MDRYQFLTAMHEVVKPDIYLEIGVQTGASLILAKDATMAIGVDPELIHLRHQPANATLFECTSDEFFEQEPIFRDLDGKSRLDLVFIDGLHHSEQAWKDLINAAMHGHRDTVYVIDDVLPRNQAEASRQMIPGDWTGDVWKIIDAFEYVHEGDHDHFFPKSMLVDTFPTGAMVIGGAMNTAYMRRVLNDQPEYFTESREVPTNILNREYAVPPQAAIEEVLTWMTP